MERIELRPGYSISRVIKGGWHLAGGHGSIDENQAIEDMRAFVEAGITTFDCADIYTGVEELIGKFIKRYKSDFNSGDLPPLQVHTKYVPDYNALASLSLADTTKIIDRSLNRLGVEHLDLVQFSWWDYQFDNYVATALHLAELQKQGKIRHIGVTNFDAQHLKEILDAGVEVVSNQVQYSVLDHRPETDMEALAQAHSIPFLCYGTVAGGFLSDRYLHAIDPEEPLENRSLVKYRLIIAEFGGYELFQEALERLRYIGENHGVNIAEVASQYILQKPMVGGVIIGARNKNHLKRLEKITSFELDDDDMGLITSIVNKSEGPKGPVYDLERDKEGRHGRIMRYNLNED
ncbi:MAG: aryl-alcohol dehydrogenase-like predicted oxidoreductase [Roseivirga sp.]|jgi:aryl-alcohol dehydrogenase-like predicted oxidoreductase